MNLEAKVLNKMYQEIKFNNTLKDSYINHDHLAPLFNIFKSINVIYHMNKMKDKNHIITSIDA